VQSSWADFALAHGLTDGNLGLYLGSWGVDAADNQVWAIVDHNSSFAVSFDDVPEPSSAAALALIAFGCLSRRRRRARA
jgi:hypothetical protein